MATVVAWTVAGLGFDSWFGHVSLR